MSNDIFEKAARKKLRFNTSVGQISTEDLWDLPLTSKSNRPNLDDIAKALHKQVSESTEVSFVNPGAKDSVDSDIRLRFDVVKRIIDVRLEEALASEKAAADRSKVQQIMGLITQKQNEALSGASIEELQQMLASIGQGQ